MIPLCLRFSLIGFLLVTNAGSAFAFSAQYHQAIHQGENLVAEFKVQMKDDKLRTESNMGGILTILIKNEKGSFSYRPAQKMAIKVPEQDRPNIAQDIPHYKEYLESNHAKVVGEETREGRLCDIYEFEDRATQLPIRVWVWREKNFPLHVEARTFQGTMVISFKDVQLDLELEDSLFEVPEGTEIEILSSQGDPPLTEPPKSLKEELVV